MLSPGRSTRSWRTLVPDLQLKLSQEIRDKQQIAIAFRITGTHTGNVSGRSASGGAIDVEGSALLTLDSPTATRSPKSARSSTRSHSQSRPEPRDRR